MSEDAFPQGEAEAFDREIDLEFRSVRRGFPGGLDGGFP
jgi:hypothetical protein